MGKQRTQSHEKSTRQKLALPAQELQSPNITSKTIKQDKKLLKKIKNQKKNLINKDNSKLMTFKIPQKREGVGLPFKEEHRHEANSALALDEYFKSVDTTETQSVDVDPFEDSICEQASLQHSNCNISFGSTTYEYDPDGLTSGTPKQVVGKSPEESTTQTDCNKHNTFPRTQQSVKFHPLANEKMVIVMKYSTSLYFQGQLSVKVLAGSLEILGCTLTGDVSNSLDVFSPGGSSLLCLTTVQVHNLSHDRNKLQNSLITLGMIPELAKTVSSKLEESDCLAIVGISQSLVASYLQSQCSIYQYPRIVNESRPFFKVENKLQCQFELDKQNISKSFTKLPEWDDLADAIVSEGRFSTETKRIMICGGKAVGKSTLLRFLINKSLRQFSEVLCIDFDPGQSEFTVPGCVSVVRILDPLVGPNYTHLLRPERMVYVGDIDISKCPNRYINCAQHILDYCESQPDLKNMVWFINTMGFSKGLGVDLVTCLIHMVKPSRLIQIESRTANRNFPIQLTSNYARNSDSPWCRKVMDGNVEVNYLHQVMRSAAEAKLRGAEADWGMQPKTARDIVVLSYISQMLLPPKFSLTDVLPVKKSFAQINLSVCHETLSYAQYLSAMNANLVALCVTREDDCVLQPSDPTMPTILAEPPIRPCLGFGIVRGIDMEARTLYLITPLSLQELETVNSLVLGAVMLPDCVYLKPNSSIGHIPYVATGPGQATSKGISRRFFFSLKQH